MKRIKKIICRWLWKDNPWTKALSLMKEGFEQEIKEAIGLFEEAKTAANNVKEDRCYYAIEVTKFDQAITKLTEQLTTEKYVCCRQCANWFCANWVLKEQPKVIPCECGQG